MNMTDRFNPANENDPKRKLAYGLIALACVIALGFGLDAASCSRTGTAGDEGGKQDATEQSAAAPKKTFAITDTEQAAKYIGDSCAGALMDAWRAFAAEKEGGADADSALFSRDHVTHNDDGTVTFTVWMPSSQKTYRGVADMAAGSVSFSE